jgi:hypothetical protein
LVADPKIRLTCDEMLNHPWMTLDLSGNKKLSVAKTALSKYVSVRKDKSKRFIDDNADGAEEDEDM